MDDFLNEIFGNGENTNPEPPVKEEPVIHEVESTPAEPEQPDFEPAEPQETAAPFESEASAFAASEPAQPSVEPKAQEQPEAAQPSGFPNGEYHYVPPQQQGSYYQPPQSAYTPPQGWQDTQPPQGWQSYQPQQPTGTFYNPPSYAAQQAQDKVEDVPTKPKKKRKGIVVLVCIAVLCGVVAIYGIFSAVNTGNKNNDKPSTSQSQQDNNDADDSDADNNSEAAQASVKSSNEAAKTDEDGNLTAAGVAQKVKESCVGITVYTEQNAYSYFYNYGQNSSSGGKTASGEGSGVIMSYADGKTYILTCAHVIADGSSFTVTLDNDEEYEATMVGYDSQTDIGVLSIEAKGLPIAEFGDSEDIEVGEDCIAIGCPGGLTFKNSVTRGIVSALDVPVSSSIGYNNECIQVDAAINPGNSGGALFNMQGQVIGINSSKIASTEYEGMGFAVPSNTAVETANSLIKNGYVAGRAKIGIQYNTLSNYNSAQSILNALAQQGYENAAGTMVIQVIDDESDLKNKGIQQYDMIVAVNGNTLTSVDVLTSVLAKSKPGDTVKLTIARIEGNQINTFDVECKLIESKQ